MGNKMTNILRILFFYCFGGGIYMTLELLYRQYTTYHMFYLAGFVTLVILLINNWLSYDTDFLLQVLICGTCALTGELICGLIFNADYSIWDYREMKFHLFGQIQLYFAIVWYLLSAIFIPILDYIDYYIFPDSNKQKPYYKIFGKIIKLF